jgi:hypothetical protein
MVIRPKRVRRNYLAPPRKRLRPAISGYGFNGPLIARRHHKIVLGSNRVPQFRNLQAQFVPLLDKAQDEPQESHG